LSPASPVLLRTASLTRFWPVGRQSRPSAATPICVGERADDLQRFERLDELAEAHVVAEVELKPAGCDAYWEAGQPLRGSTGAVG
jgi:hypothetical protein